MQISKIILTALLLILSVSLFGKAVPRDVIFYGIDKDIARLKLVAASVEKLTKDKLVQLGSGCLVHVGGEVNVLTCYHLVKDLKEEEMLMVGVNSNIGKVYYSAEITRYDSTLDLSLLSVDRLIGRQLNKIEALPSKDLELEQVPLDTSIFADTFNIREGLSAVMIGFPLGLGAELISNYPISRIGIVAQVIPQNPLFLIDGMVSHGNSGSPVFSGYEVKFIGIIKGTPVDKINAFDEKQNLVISLPYNSGLTYCISAIEIKKFLYSDK